MELILDKLWGNYGEFNKIRVGMYRNFIPNGVLMRSEEKFDEDLVGGLGFRT